jgi:septal ring factor EnvC (AmiA/AmiB activator)
MKIKRISCWLPFVVAATLPLAGNGQNANNAALIAERQELEEKYKALSASVQALQESNAALQKKLDAVLAELNEMREKAGKTPANLATQEDIKKLAEKIVDLDKTRIADNKLVLEKVAELVKPLLKQPPPSPGPRKTTDPNAGKQEKGYDYVVQSGDTLTKIIKAYRDNGIKVSQKAIEEANPTVNWNKLVIGQKIWIPAPKE